MKSRYKTFSVSDIDKEIQIELEKYKDEVYENVTKDVFNQALSVCFTALELMGWRKKRLTDFFNQCDEVCYMMYNGVMGREVTTRQAMKHLKEAYGIDFGKSNYDYGEKENES